ncbi:zinc ABC transporter substrate-binding protein [Dickeya zeae]|uniref:Zinc ABC transporter substrate-binding protein n=1 Tax=Dickeya zeae TaxID=204042 RepID=A0ABX8VZF0_9GAMM|nr:zinc ABC transporter substrate-binding protein [Dickeya zeae]QYM93160.1 zinc ABC transporter substrate-binding protein [Dickeya zeae]
MTKQEIYKNILDLVLPYIRNVQSQNAWVRARDRSCYFDVELIHNLSKNILDFDFVDHDIWFLNNQARYYFEKCSDDISPNYTQNVEYIKLLFKIVPDELKSRLSWGGIIGYIF